MFEAGLDPVLTPERWLVAEQGSRYGRYGLKGDAELKAPIFMG